MRRERAPPAPPQRPNWTWEKTLEAKAGVWGGIPVARGCQDGHGWDRGLPSRQLRSCHGRGSGLSGSLGWVVIGCHGKQVPQPSGVP